MVTFVKQVEYNEYELRVMRHCRYVIEENTKGLAKAIICSTLMPSSPAAVFLPKDLRKGNISSLLPGNSKIVLNTAWEIYLSGPCLELCECDDPPDF